MIGLRLPIARGTWTPTVTAASGMITTATATGRYFKFGNRFWFRVSISITTNGTGSGDVRFTLPATPSDAGVAHGRESSVTGFALAANINSASTLVGVVNYDNSYPGGNGHNLIVAGFFDT